MKKISIILGLSLIITGLGYILFYKKDDDNDEKTCVDKPKDEPEIKPGDEKEDELDVDKEIKDIVLSGNYNDPGDLVLLIINTVVQKAKSGFEILQRVPKNIEELEDWINKNDVREVYENILYKKYKTEE